MRKQIVNFVVVLKTAYPYAFKDMTDEEVEQMVNLYEEMLGGYSEETLNQVVKEIIKTRKFLPTLNEIIELCESNKIYKRNEIIDYMEKDGYFKNPNELDKAYFWVNEGNIPGWLLEEMKKYHKLLIEEKQRKLIGE